MELCKLLLVLCCKVRLIAFVEYEGEEIEKILFEGFWFDVPEAYRNDIVFNVVPGKDFSGLIITLGI